LVVGQRNCLRLLLLGYCLEAQSAGLARCALNPKVGLLRGSDGGSTHKQSYIKRLAVHAAVPLHARCRGLQAVINMNSQQ
jgi:hypothetical protein